LRLAALEHASADEDRGYRSVLVFLKYGRAGPAIITTAIASPASNEMVSINILVTHFGQRDAFHRRATNCQIA